MKTSISDTIRIEKYLLGSLTPNEKILFESRLQGDRELNADVFFQRMTYRLLRFYHRTKVKSEIREVHERLFNDPSKGEFRKAVLKHFNQ